MKDFENARNDCNEDSSRCRSRCDGASNCYHNGNCKCNHPNCQGPCRCNCKGIKEDSSNETDSMCNGVFAPICEPEVCDIPRFSHTQDLVVGYGTIDDETSVNREMYSKHGTKFTIHIYREFTEHFGEFALYDSNGALTLESNKLECFHAPNEESMVAIFHVAFEDDTSREVTVYGKTKTSESPAELYVYSAPLNHEEIRLGSKLLNGKLNLYQDLMGHNH